MSFFRILWDDPNDPYGNVEHVAEHGLDIEDVEAEFPWRIENSNA